MIHEQSQAPLHCTILGFPMHHQVQGRRNSKQEISAARPKNLDRLNGVLPEQFLPKNGYVLFDYHPMHLSDGWWMNRGIERSNTRELHEVQRHQTRRVHKDLPPARRLESSPQFPFIPWPYFPQDHGQGHWLMQILAEGLSIVQVLAYRHETIV